MSKLNNACLAAVAEDNQEKVEEIAEMMNELKVFPRAKPRFSGEPKDAMANYLKETRPFDREEHVLDDAEKMAVWAEENPPEKKVAPVPQPRKKVAPVPQPQKKVAPIPQPRKKVVPPIPQPRKKVAPIPQPRKKVAPPDEKEAAAEEEQEPPQPTEEDTQDRYLRQINDELRREEVNRIRHRGENLYNMRLKYPGWFLDRDVDVGFETTMMVLFNPETGVDIPVKDFKEIAKYFASRGYVDFPDKAEFDATIKQGTWKFITSTSELQAEEWIRFIFIWGY